MDGLFPKTFLPLATWPLHLWPIGEGPPLKMEGSARLTSEGYSVSMKVVKEHSVVTRGQYARKADNDG